MQKLRGRLGLTAVASAFIAGAFGASASVTANAAGGVPDIGAGVASGTLYFPVWPCPVACAGAQYHNNNDIKPTNPAGMPGGNPNWCDLTALRIFNAPFGAPAPRICA